MRWHLRTINEKANFVRRPWSYSLVPVLFCFAARRRSDAVPYECRRSESIFGGQMAVGRDVFAMWIGGHLAF